MDRNLGELHVVLGVGRWDFRWLAYWHNRANVFALPSALLPACFAG